MRGTGSTKWLSLSMTLALPLALACGGSETGGEMDDAGMQETGQEMSAAPGSQTVSFTALNDSGVTGDVAFERADGTLTIDVLAQNLGGPGDYPSHVHEGTCDQPGGVVAPLENAVAHEPGVGEASSDVDATQLTAGTSYVVMVHGLQGTPVACAEVPASLVGAGA